MKNLNLTFLIVFCLVLATNFSVYANKKILLMATTTSVDNTGLLDYLSPYFSKDTGIELRWIVTGSGKAFEHGKKCDVDVLFVHEPKSEVESLKNEFTVKRNEIMYNSFVLLGPTSDPANIKGLDILSAFESIRKNCAIFVSRGDGSGTNIFEIGLWQDAKLVVPDDEFWYIQTGQGMLATLNLASELGGYILADMGTYIKYIDDFSDIAPLEIYIEGGDRLKNQYSILLVNPNKCSKCNFNGAISFLNWIIGDDAQELIRDFKLKGKQLFLPNAN